jgi:ribosomal protein S18 acetylase RimI-like enzyme
MPVYIATIDDLPAILLLVNSAYRGESSKQGWTTEANLLLGDKRTDADTLMQMMQTPGTAFLKYINDAGVIEGSVFLHKKENKLYLGMLSVNPALQVKGIGKILMSAAEDFAKQTQCSSIYMTVISVRQELINWYERRGYFKTGETQPFPANDSFGVPTQHLEMVVMEKKIHA